MLKLEPMNPTDKPARSPVLNGVWEFLYTGGISPGTLAVQVRRVICAKYISCALKGTAGLDGEGEGKRADSGNRRRPTVVACRERGKGGRSSG